MALAGARCGAGESVGGGLKARGPLRLPALSGAATGGPATSRRSSQLRPGDTTVSITISIRVHSTNSSRTTIATSGAAATAAAARRATPGGTTLNTATRIHSTNSSSTVAISSDTIGTTIVTALSAHAAVSCTRTTRIRIQECLRVPPEGEQGALSEDISHE